VEVFAYAGVSRPDDLTQRLRSCTDGWRNTVGLSDSQTADLIREDQIDILVDLTLHMAGNRLLVFARKPAPVQVTWLGYPSSTGLSTMDYRLTDPHMEPPGIRDAFSIERTIRLASTFQLYDLDPQEVPVNELPASGRGFVTFGCLNNFCKINQPQLLLWARILQQVKNSKLVLLTWPGNHRQRTAEFLSAHGIAPQRLIFPDKTPTHGEYLQLYHEIDLGLDAYPYNGHTTSMDSLWMGVPVVSLYGPMAVSRAGLSQSSNLGLADLATESAEDYVRIAAELAGDLPRLSELRRNLRQMMRQSPLMDAPKFARNIEAAYRQMWHTWCKPAPTT
jgi:predicted O-linked N-acetylglucosamine transferase (SPINDLY family)